jgi:ribosomal protein L37E
MNTDQTATVFGKYLHDDGTLREVRCHVKCSRCGEIEDHRFHNWAKTVCSYCREIIFRKEEVSNESK